MLTSSSTAATAQLLVEYCRKRQHLVAIKELYSEHCISREMPGVPSSITEGKTAILKKNEEWFSMVSEFHRLEISDPVVSDKFFCCHMELDVTFKEQPRMVLNELCIYEVMDGQIVSEQFFYR